MSTNQKYVLILWGNDFEEVQTVSFVAHLRAAGLNVKLVSISGPRVSGGHGIILLPDITLTQALLLAQKTICVIVPGGRHSLLYLRNDPRIEILFEEAKSNGAYFVIRQVAILSSPESSMLSPLVFTNRLLFYEDDDCPSQFVQELIGLFEKVAE